MVCWRYSVGKHRYSHHLCAPCLRTASSGSRFSVWVCALQSLAEDSAVGFTPTWLRFRD